MPGPPAALRIPRPGPSGYARVPSFRLSEVGRSASHSRNTSAELGDDGEEDELVDDDVRLSKAQAREEGANGDEKSLERSLEIIGMGRYQYRLLILCGLGWLCDNMYLACLAIILPRVQDQFAVPSAQIGSLSASMMTGMMVGALGWGSAADTVGRTIPFNATLALTAVFGFASSYAGSFASLRVWIFLLGTAVGGSMPTDGAIVLENIPTRSQFLLTGLSVFFSIGAVIASILGLLIIPTGSCPDAEAGKPPPPCDLATENDGWRMMLRILSGLTLAMFLSRLFLFRLHESPRYLATTDRADQALDHLRLIALYNKHTIDLTSDDVRTPNVSRAPTPLPSSPIPSPTFPAEREASAAPGYEATSSHPVERPKFPFSTPTKEQNMQFMRGLRTSLDEAAANGDARGRPALPRPSSLGVRPDLAAQRGRMNSHSPMTGGTGEREGLGKGWGEKAKEGVVEMGAKVAGLFGPKWRRTTVLIWVVWGAMSLAYTMFNSFLPILLESRVDPTSSKGGRVESLQELLLYTLAGLPGPLLGAYLIETPHLNRRITLVIFTVLTALATLTFSAVRTKAGVILSSMAISLAGSCMYSVLYSMTPEIFATEIRGTASGAAAAISRLTGISAPLLTGYLLSLHPSFPLYTSAAGFVLAAACTAALPFEKAEDAGRTGEREEDEADE